MKIMDFHERHILSDTLLFSALINILVTGLNFYSRLALTGQVPAVLPYMDNDTLWDDQMIYSIVQFAATAAVFTIEYFRYKKFNEMARPVEYIESALCTESGEDVLMPAISFEGSKLTLSRKSIWKLLQIWGYILIGVRVLYDMSVIYYRTFIDQMSMMISDAANADRMQQGITAIYNGTHGFKYFGMFTAIMLGVVATGIFLQDRSLKIIAIALTLLFMAAFGVFHMGTVTVSGVEYGIVWTAIIFHMVDTVGLFLFALYLRYKYEGV
jgi:hypothetical protein